MDEDQVSHCVHKNCPVHVLNGTEQKKGVADTDKAKNVLYCPKIIDEIY